MSDEEYSDDDFGKLEDEFEDASDDIPEDPIAMTADIDAEQTEAEDDLGKLSGNDDVGSSLGLASPQGAPQSKHGEVHAGEDDEPLVENELMDEQAELEQQNSRVLEDTLPEETRATFGPKQLELAEQAGTSEAASAELLHPTDSPQSAANKNEEDVSGHVESRMTDEEPFSDQELDTITSVAGEAVLVEQTTLEHEQEELGRVAFDDEKDEIAHQDEPLITTVASPLSNEARLLLHERKLEEMEDEQETSKCSAPPEEIHFHLSETIEGHEEKDELAPIEAHDALEDAEKETEGLEPTAHDDAKLDERHESDDLDKTNRERELDGSVVNAGCQPSVLVCNSGMDLEIIEKEHPFGLSGPLSLVHQEVALQPPALEEDNKEDDDTTMELASPKWLSSATNPLEDRPLTVEEYFRDGLTREQISAKREAYEGRESASRIARHRGTRRTPTLRGEVKVFSPGVMSLIAMMKEKGNGKVTVAWRRYFDSDGDGSLSFTEFCAALVDLGFQGADSSALFTEIGMGPDGIPSKELELWMLDPEGAEILDFFSQWCHEAYEGPYEVFKLIDENARDSLSSEEFAQGLKGLGFFSYSGVPGSIDDIEKAKKNLFTLLDTGGVGCLQCDKLIFFERDRSKRDRLLEYVKRLRQYGISNIPQKPANDAEVFLNKLALNHTALGGKCFKMLKGEAAELACGTTKLGSRRQLSMRSVRDKSRRQSIGSSGWSSSMVEPASFSANLGGFKSSQSTPAISSTNSAGESRRPGIVPPLILPKGEFPLLERKRPVSGWGGGNRRLIVHGGVLGEGKPMLDHGPGLDARSIYSRSLVPPLPPVVDFPILKGRRVAAELLSMPQKTKASGECRFDPSAAIGEDFFRTRFLASLFNHYG